MKIPKLAAFILSSVLLTFSAHAQSLLSCVDFSITGVAPDESNPDFTLINIQMQGAASDFINYPYITTVTDCNGNTIATGSMFFFGQMGQTTQAYPVTAFGADVCYPITAEFFYGNTDFENDTCLLTFDGSGLYIQTKKQDFISVYPNPANGVIGINTPAELIGCDFALFDVYGQLVLSGQFTALKNRIDLSMIPSGMYILKSGNQELKFVNSDQ